MNGKSDSKMTREKDLVISDSGEDELPDIACDICEIEFPSVRTYEAHLKGKKHHKMISKIKLKKKVLDYNTVDKDVADDKEEDIEGDSELNCDVCEKSFTGYVPYVTHLKGGAHKKNTKRQKIKDGLKDMPEILRRENVESDSDEDGILPKTYAKCGACKKVFYGPESFQQHVKGSTHKRKLLQQKVVENLKSLNEANSEEDDTEPFSNCETCGKSFSGPVPYQIHMKSAVHQKGVEKSAVIKELKDFCLEDSEGTKYVCKDCNKKFSDPLAFKKHLTNNGHEKQKARLEISNFLEAYPEMLMVTPDNEAEEEEERESSNCCDQDSFWICKICHVSFSGPENARDHLRSIKHFNVKTELRKKKLLNDRKKNQNSSSPIQPQDEKANRLSKKTLPSDCDSNLISRKSENQEGFNEEFELI